MNSKMRILIVLIMITGLVSAKMCDAVRGLDPISY